jgi:hypothetical protein
LTSPPDPDHHAFGPAPPISTTFATRPLSPLSQSALSAARQFDLTPYVDQLIANGIGLDTIVMSRLAWCLDGSPPRGSTC